jgi:kynureninase
MNLKIEQAVRALASGELEEGAVAEHVHPLFSRVLKRNEIYLANHSLGRPLDQTGRDVEQALELWYRDMSEAWEGWLAERERFRSNVARLIAAPSADCIVPKTSAGQGLRAILNGFDERIKVVTTSGEFDSIDIILKVYAARGRIDLAMVPPRDGGEFDAGDIARAIGAETSLVVVSTVMFQTGQVLDVAPVQAACRAHGAKLLLDLYHAAGAIPFDIVHLGADFAIGGSYKYLRGGPGAAWLYLHPCHLDGSFCTLDTGWCAGLDPFSHERIDQLQLAPGGNAFLESTPAVLPFFQARAGLEFTLAIGVERLRAYSLKQQASLAERLRAEGIEATGAREDRGAFVIVRHPRAQEVVNALREQGVVADARGNFLRLCPDILNTEQELSSAAQRLAEVYLTTVR